MSVRVASSVIVPADATLLNNSRNRNLARREPRLAPDFSVSANQRCGRPRILCDGIHGRRGVGPKPCRTFWNLLTGTRTVRKVRDATFHFTSVDHHVPRRYRRPYGPIVRACDPANVPTWLANALGPACDPPAVPTWLTSALGPACDPPAVPTCLAGAFPSLGPAT